MAVWDGLQLFLYELQLKRRKFLVLWTLLAILEVGIFCSEGEASTLGWFLWGEVSWTVKGSSYGS